MEKNSRECDKDKKFPRKARKFPLCEIEEAENNENFTYSGCFIGIFNYTELINCKTVSF